MQYNININQEKLAETKLDLIDSAILEYLYHLCNSRSEAVEKNRLLNDDGKKMTWVNYDALILDMPLLRITRKGALTPRFQRLVNEGFILTRKGGGNRQYVLLLPKVDDLYLKTEGREFTKMNSGSNEPKAVVPEFTKMNSSVHENEFQNSRKRTNSYTNNSYTNNSKREEKREKAEASLSFLQKLPEIDISEFTQKYQVTETQLISKADDLLNYCESKGKRYANYKAFLRNAVKKDFGLRKQQLVREVVEEEYTPEQRMSASRKMDELRNSMRQLGTAKSVKAILGT